MSHSKRLFIGMSLETHWPEVYPPGRIISENNRHLTLAFLGEIPLEACQKLITTFPKPDFHIGPPGCFDRCLPLPIKYPRLISWHVELWNEKIQKYQKRIIEWLDSLLIPTEKRDWLPHVTISRSFENIQNWMEAFSPQPFYVKESAIFESKGNSTYERLHQIQLIPPFEEIEHTADLAYLVRGIDLQELYLNACLALSFRCPPLMKYIKVIQVLNLNEIVYNLNQLIRELDVAQGSPFKAVSYHGEIVRNQYLEWEMIVDV